MPDGQGSTYPPLAQVAERQGPVVAANVLATIHGQPLRPFEYHIKGMLASLGRRRGVAEVFGHRFSGLPAWLMWRTVYLSKLPGLDRKVRVGLDWLADLVFPPDDTETGIDPYAALTHAAAPAATSPTASATTSAAAHPSGTPPSTPLSATADTDAKTSPAATGDTSPSPSAP
jgi:hypothetical protein